MLIIMEIIIIVKACSVFRVALPSSTTYNILLLIIMMRKTVIYRSSPIQVSCRRLKKNKFNVSMFERLVNNNFPYDLLMRQSRMHPDLIGLFSYHYPAQKREAGFGLKSNDQVTKPSIPLFL